MNNVSKKILVNLILVSYITINWNLGLVFAKTGDIKSGIEKSLLDQQSGIELKGGIKIDKRRQLITLSLRDSDIRQVLRMLADKAGVNIVFHDSITGTITLDLINTDVNKAFEYVMTLKQLTYWQDGNTLIVASQSEGNKLGLNKSKIKPIKINYLDSAAVASFLNNNIFSLNKPNISSSSIVVSNPRSNEVIIFGNNNDIALAEKTIALIDVKPLMKTFDLNYSEPTSVANNLCNTLFSNTSNSDSNNDSNSSSGNSNSNGNSNGNSNNGNGNSSSNSSNNGGTSGGSSSKNSTYWGNQSYIACKGGSTLSDENNNGTSTSNTTTTNNNTNGENKSLTSLDTLGYSVIVNSDLSQVTVMGTQEQINMAEEFVKSFDKKQPQAYIEISIIELTESGSKSLQSSLNYFNGNTTSYFKGDGTRFSYVFSGGSPLSKSINQSVDMIIKQNKGRVLANPRILAMNNKESKVNISSDFIKSIKTETVGIGNTAQTIQTPEISEAGIELTLTPKISSNGFVTINLVPSYTSEKGKESYSSGDGITNVVTLLNRRDLNLANIRVKDGETIVIGGLIQETDLKSNTKFPVLGDVPLINVLFKNSDISRSKSELILMLTPRIIKEDDPTESI